MEILISLGIGLFGKIASSFIWTKAQLSLWDRFYNTIIHDRIVITMFIIIVLLISVILFRIIKTMFIKIRKVFTVTYLFFKRLAFITCIIAIAYFIFVNTAHAKTINKWKGIVIHITDTRLDYNLKMCNRGHKAIGWDSCGYNYLILRDGTLEIARGAYKQGAHVAGYNSKYLGIGFVGNKDNKRATNKQLSTYLELKKNLDKMFKTNFKIYPHNHFNSKKECPYEIYKQLKGN